MSGLARGDRQSAVRNDSRCYFACLCGTLRRVLAGVCQVMRVLHRMKPATEGASSSSDETRYRRSKIYINPGYLWTRRGPEMHDEPHRTRYKGREWPAC